jgi:protein-S-isoprenylcysteine O-methyltransferase Ste14
MKKRIQIDSSILFGLIFVTLVLFNFPQSYPSSRVLDNVLDFFGLITVLKGNYLRMAARGHKRANSQNGNDLVMTGLYAYMRNPMYLGTFLIGTGFVLMLWPWWLAPFFMALFYFRFIRQITFEEKCLNENFGEKYAAYCQKTPRLFPDLGQMFRINFRREVPLKEAFATKEKWWLLILPFWAVLLETLKEKLVFGATDIRVTILIFLLSACAFALGLWFRYFFPRGNSSNE